MISANLFPQISSGNSDDNISIDALGEWVGSAEFNLLSDVLVTAQITGPADIYLQFSEDGVSWTSSIKVIYDPSKINPPQPRVKGPRFYRTRIVNPSGTTSITVTRVTTYYGDFKTLVSDLNSVVPQAFPGTVTRPIDFGLMVAKGLYQGHNNTIKDGFNSDIDTASVPEDITNEGGIYAGFPTGAVQPGELVVSGADTGTVFISLLTGPSDTDYIFVSIPIAGPGSYPLGVNVWRSNFMYFVASSQTVTNVGEITLRNTVTTTNVFCVIPVGYGQTFCSAYTVPAGADVYIDRITGAMKGATSGTLDGAFYYRESTGGFRLRFPFVLQFGSLYFDDVDYLIKIPAGTDFIPRILTASTNNLQAQISYRIIKVSR